MAMLEQMVRLADVLRDEHRREVLCHGDLHPGNVLLADDGLHLIDWGEVLLAPRDRDFLFVPDLPPSPEAAPSGAPAEPAPPLGTAFLRGYGLTETEIDWVALTYYRCERVIQDVIAEADHAAKLIGQNESTEPADIWLRHVLQPGGEADAAVAAAVRLPDELNVLRHL